MKDNALLIIARFVIFFIVVFPLIKILYVRCKIRKSYTFILINVFIADVIFSVIYYFLIRAM